MCMINLDIFAFLAILSKKWKNLNQFLVTLPNILIWEKPWKNVSLQDEPWAEFSTLEVAACIPCTYCPV
jgi:hypothetical protein